jgi:hypothetical protein
MAVDTAEERMSVEIRPVSSRDELKTFIKLPWRRF